MSQIKGKHGESKSRSLPQSFAGASCSIKDKVWWMVVARPWIGNSLTFFIWSLGKL